jgi:hypothetical protein
MMYDNMSQAALNRQRWTTEEDEALKDLISKDLSSAVIVGIMQQRFERPFTKGSVLGRAQRQGYHRRAQAGLAPMRGNR